MAQIGMIHYTINTGIQVTQDLDRVSHGAMTMLRPLVTAGRRRLPPPFAVYRVQIDRGDGSALLTILRTRADFGGLST